MKRAKNKDTRGNLKNPCGSNFHYVPPEGIYLQDKYKNQFKKRTWFLFFSLVLLWFKMVCQSFPIYFPKLIVNRFSGG